MRKSLVPKVRKPRGHFFSVLGKLSSASFPGRASNALPVLPIVFPLLITHPVRVTSAVISARIPPTPPRFGYKPHGVSWALCAYCCPALLEFFIRLSPWRNTSFFCRVSLCCSSIIPATSPGPRMSLKLFNAEWSYKGGNKQTEQPRRVLGEDPV